MKANYRKSSLLGIALFALVTTSAFGDIKDTSGPLLPLTNTWVELQVCSDTARSYKDDEGSARKYREAAEELYSRSREVGWAELEIAAAMSASLDDMRDRTDLVVQDGDTVEEFQLRNYPEEHCEDQLMVAREFLEGNIPKPGR